MEADVGNLISGGATLGMAQQVLDAVLILVASAFLAAFATLIVKQLATSSEDMKDTRPLARRLANILATVFVIVLISRGGVSLAENFTSISYDPYGLNSAGTSAEPQIGGRGYSEYLHPDFSGSDESGSSGSGSGGSGSGGSGSGDSGSSGDSGNSYAQIDPETQSYWENYPGA